MAVKKVPTATKFITPLLIVVVIALAVGPLLFLQDAEFSGADSQAEEVIAELNQDYQPWFQPIWEPPSSEVESLLFAVQAALGAGVIGYIMGYTRRQRKAAKNKDVSSG